MGIASALAVAFALTAQTAPQPALNVEELDGRTFWVRDGEDAKVSLTLVEISRKAPIRGLTVRPGDVLKSGSKEARPGKIELADVKPVDVSTGGVAQIDLKLSAFTEPGEHTARIYVTAKNLPPVSFPIRIFVTTPAWCAVLLIFAGVLGGFLIQLINQVLRPRQELSIELLALRQRAQRLLMGASEPGKRGRIIAALERVATAELRTGDGSLDLAKKERDAIAALLDTLEQEERAQRTKSLAAYHELEAAILNLPAADPDLEPLRAGVEEVRALLTAERHDEADRRLAQLRKQLDALKQRTAIADEANRIEAVFSELQAVDAAMTAEFAAKKRELDRALSANRIEDANASLHALHALMKEASTPGQGAMPGVVERESAAGRIGTLAVINPSGAAAVRTGEEVVFAIAPKPASFDAIEWSFGDGERARTEKLEARHVFRITGECRVEATMIAAGRPIGFIRALTISVRAPDDAARAQKRQWLVAGDWAVLAASIVLATLSGVLVLYIDKPFGSMSDMIVAFLWGFGLDGTVRGFSPIFKRLTTPAA